MSTSTPQEEPIPADFLKWAKQTAEEYLQLPEGHSYGETSRYAQFVDDFVCGAISSYRKLSQKVAPGMRMVNASERMPKRGAFVPAKVQLERSIRWFVLYVMKHNGRWSDYDGKVIEWLEESPVIPSDKDKEIERLTKLCAEADNAFSRVSSELEALKAQKGSHSIHSAVRAIRQHTDQLIAQGPEACRKFLEDAGIIEGNGLVEEEKPEWVEVDTPPAKDGIYNVVTHCNNLIVSAYQNDRWDYDSVWGGRTGPDFVVRYRPSTFQPLPSPTPETQPIADSKEVPEEIMEWVKGESENYAHQMNYNAPAPHDGDYDLTADREVTFQHGAIAMYQKMMEGEVTKANTRYSDAMLDLRAAEKERDRQESLKKSCLSTIEDSIKKEKKTDAQISALLASNKKWGEKYLAVEKEMLDYRKALEQIKRMDTWDKSNQPNIPVYGQYGLLAKLCLDQYRSPVNTEQKKKDPFGPGITDYL